MGLSLENLIVDASAMPEIRNGDSLTLCTGRGGGGAAGLEDLAAAQGMSAPQLAYLFSRLGRVVTVDECPDLS